jgi:hypothetical protein
MPAPGNTITQPGVRSANLAKYIAFKKTLLFECRSGAKLEKLVKGILLKRRKKNIGRGRRRVILRTWNVERVRAEYPDMWGMMCRQGKEKGHL